MSVCRSVRNHFTFFMIFGHNCSSPITRDCAFVYTNLFVCMCMSQVCFCQSFSIGVCLCDTNTAISVCVSVLVIQCARLSQSLGVCAEWVSSNSGLLSVHLSMHVSVIQCVSVSVIQCVSVIRCVSVLVIQCVFLSQSFRTCVGKSPFHTLGVCASFQSLSVCFSCNLSFRHYMQG